MNGKIRRPARFFETSFKRQVAQMVTEKGLTVTQVCKEMDVGETAIRRWIRQFGTAVAGQPNIGESASAEQRIRCLEDENRRLRALVDTGKVANSCQEADIRGLRVVVDILPKALAIFVRELR